MSDTTLQAFSVDVLPVEEGAQFLVIGILTGIQTPFAGPDGQPVSIPTDVYRVQMGKDAVRELVKALEEQAEKLPEPRKPSGIVVPGNPGDADKIANDLKRFQG